MDTGLSSASLFVSRIIRQELGAYMHNVLFNHFRDRICEAFVWRVYILVTYTLLVSSNSVDIVFDWFLLIIRI